MPLLEAVPLGTVSKFGFNWSKPHLERLSISNRTTGTAKLRTPKLFVAQTSRKTIYFLEKTLKVFLVPTVNSNLKETRQLRGMSQLQLALRAGVSTRTIQFAESGKSLTESTVRKIARALSMQSDQLLRIDPGQGQDAFTKLPWSLGDRFESKELSDQGSYCRDEAEVIEVVQNLRENFSIQIRKWGSPEEQARALKRDAELTRSYFRYEQRYLDIWRRNPGCFRVDRFNETLCGVSISLPISQDCFDDFQAGERSLFDITADDLCDQSQTILLDSVTEFANQSDRPWYHITESLSFISIAQIADLAVDPGSSDFQMISFSASPLNERRLTSVGFESVERFEPEFRYPIFVFGDQDNPDRIDHYSIRSTLKHFSHLIKAVNSKSTRRKLMGMLLSMIKRRQRTRTIQPRLHAA